MVRLQPIRDCVSLDALLSDKAADILANICTRVSASPHRALSMSLQGATPEGPSWTLKANVTVFRHADRTPKQKLKYNFPISETWVQPFVRLLNGEREEVILRERDQLEAIALAVEEARSLGASGDELVKLSQLNTSQAQRLNSSQDTRKVGIRGHESWRSLCWSSSGAARSVEFSISKPNT